MSDIANTDCGPWRNVSSDDVSESEWGRGSVMASAVSGEESGGEEA